MNTSPVRLLAGGLLMLAIAAAGDAARAQAPAAPTAPVATPKAAPAADLEPAVDTSAASPGAVARPSAGPAPAPQPGVDAKATTSSRPDPGTGKPAAPRAAARPAGRAMDRVDLESSQITGNRELPRVLYIVPWRAPEAGDLEGRPVNSLLYELTRPVDRDVFRRENRYFDALRAQSPNADANAAAPAGEK